MPHPFRIALSLLCLSLWLPAHAEKNLKRPPGTTRYAALVRQLTDLRDYDQDHAKRLTLTSLGKSVKGRDLWMVTLHDPDAQPGKRVFYLCRQHGHEPASTEGALAFITSLVKAEPDTAEAKELSQATVYVVPMANPDGAEAYLRRNAHDVDLNRDWLHRTQPETRALYAALLRLHPDLVTDQHELYPNDTRSDFTETAGPNSGASQSLIAECDETQSVVQGAMTAEGYPTVTHLITDTHPARLAHRYGCIVLGLPTILFETNRLTGSGRTVAARAAAHEEFMKTVLRDQAGEQDQLVAEAATWQAAHARPDALLASRHKPLPTRVAPPQMPPAVPAAPPATDVPPAAEKGAE